MGSPALAFAVGSRAADLAAAWGAAAFAVAAVAGADPNKNITTVRRGTKR
jgi:hypothetical protein